MSFADYAIVFGFISPSLHTVTCREVKKRGAEAECRGDAEREKEKEKRKEKRERTYEADAKTYIHEMLLMLKIC
jgi:hypothetical protein